MSSKAKPTTTKPVPDEDQDLPMDRSYGSDEGGGFNEPSKAYKQNPTIENYVRLRRENPDAEIEVSVIGGFEQLMYMETELRRFGIDPTLAAGAMDANQAAIGELSLQLLEKIIEARSLAKVGETHLARRGRAIPDKLIDWLITCALDAMSWNDYPVIPRDFIVLIRERLGGSNPAYEQGSRVHQHKTDAAMIAGQLKAQGVKPTLKILGELLEVAPSTVKRWFAEGELEKETERWSRMFDEKGDLRPIKKPNSAPLHTKDSAQR